MTEVQGKAKHAATKGASPDVAYYSPAQSRIPDFNFDRVNGPDRGFRVQQIATGNLMGSSVFESVLYTPSHIDTRVFQSLAQSMEVIEKKLHGGQYDAQAIPLIEAFLTELRAMAQIQVERNKINDQRICDLKEANVVAYHAVCEARERREEGIEKARMHRFDRMAAEFDKRAARAQVKDEREAEKEEAGKEKETGRLKRREVWREAREARKMRRYERQMQREQARADKEAKKWEKRLVKAEFDLEKVRSEKDTKQAESLARKAAAETEIEIARAKAKEASVLEERARLELERVRSLVPQVPETPAGEEDAPLEEPVVEVAVEADGETSDAVPAKADGETLAEVVAEDDGMPDAAPVEASTTPAEAACEVSACEGEVPSVDEGELDDPVSDEVSPEREES